MKAISGVLAVAALMMVTSGLGAPPDPPALHAFTLEASELQDGSWAFNGIVPGPTLDVNLGDSLVVTLVNRLADPASFHVHGMVIPAAMDGVKAHVGTELIDSTAAPNGTMTYRFRAAHAGAWHYHDHAIGGVEGELGIRKGLYGSVIVRPPGETRGSVVDMHFLDDGAHTSATTVPAGPLDIVIVGLGDLVWTVTFDGFEPVRVGPGISQRIHIDSASGAYPWNATSHYGDERSGTVTAS